MGKFLSYRFAHVIANGLIGLLTRRGAQTTTPPPPLVGIAPPTNQPPNPGGGAAPLLTSPDIEWDEGPSSRVPMTNLLDDIELSDI